MEATICIIVKGVALYMLIVYDGGYIIIGESQKGSYEFSPFGL